MLYATIDEDSLTEDNIKQLSGLTLGRKYRVINDEIITASEEGVLRFPGFWITPDSRNTNIYCLIESCAHLAGGNWIITEE